MRVLMFGQLASPALSEALADGGLVVEAAPPPQAGDDGATAELAAALRGAEQALAADAAACAIVAGAGDTALGAALAAVKMDVPTAWLAPAEGPAEARLIGRVADLTVAANDDAQQAAGRIRSLAAPRIRSR